MGSQSLDQRRLSPRSLVQLKLAASLAIILVLFQYVDFADVWARLRQTDLELFAISCLASILGQVFSALRWVVLMARLKPAITVTDALVGTFEAAFFNQVLPSTIGGDAFRAARIVDSGGSIKQALTGVFIDRILGLWFVCAFVAVISVIGDARTKDAAVFASLANAGRLITLGGIGAVIAGCYIKPAWFARWLAPFVALVQTFSQTVRAWRSMLPLFIGLTVAYAFSLAGFVACAWAQGSVPAPLDAAIIFAGLLLSGMLPVSIGGWGLREAAAILLFAPLGVSPAQAASVSILYGLSLIVVGLAGGLVWLSAGYRRIGAADQSLFELQQAKLE